MSKMSDLKYALQSLSSSIDGIEDVNQKSACEEFFAEVENQISDIESDIQSVLYDVNKLV